MLRTSFLLVAVWASFFILGDANPRPYDRVFPLDGLAMDWSLVAWADYNQIIVTGPPASGVDTFAKALARYLGHNFVDSKRTSILTNRETGEALPVHPSSNVATIASIKEKVVLERPSWVYLLHRLPKLKKTFIAFIGRDCLDSFADQNRIMMDIKSDAGWTCKYGREREYAQYKSDPELSSLVTSLHDMICTIKQGAYLNLQKSKLKLNGIDSEAIAYSSLNSMPGFIGAPSDLNTTRGSSRGASQIKPSRESEGDSWGHAALLAGSLPTKNQRFREGRDTPGLKPLSPTKPRAHSSGLKVRPKSRPRDQDHGSSK